MQRFLTAKIFTAKISDCKACNCRYEQDGMCNRTSSVTTSDSNLVLSQVSDASVGATVNEGEGGRGGGLSPLSAMAMDSVHAASHCNTLQHTATHCNTLQHTATHCNTPQHTATHCNTLLHTATYCNTLHTLQHAATHCSTLQQAQCDGHGCGLQVCV